jgi:competence protein ComEA
VFEWERRTQIVVSVVIVALIFGAGYKYATIAAVPDIEISAEQQQQQPEETMEIVVHITGAVEKPGVYVFNPGARVNDAVNKAVPLPEACLDAMNLAAVLEDGKRIEVPVKVVKAEQEQAPRGSGTTASVAAGQENPKINLNAATAQELDTLPGIGPAYAERIIAYRDQHGGFSSIEELQDIAGIGPKTYEKLKDMICIY